MVLGRLISGKTVVAARVIPMEEEEEGRTEDEVDPAGGWSDDS